MNLNKIMIAGRLTRDPEIKYTPSGLTIAELGLAVNRRRKGADGEWSEEATFLDVTLWESQAEVAQKYLRKGDGVFIEGRLHKDTWEDKATGKKRTSLKIVGERMQMMGGRQDLGNEAPGPQPPPGTQGEDQSESKFSVKPRIINLEKGDTDEIPF